MVLQRCLAVSLTYDFPIRGNSTGGWIAVHLRRVCRSL